MAYLFATVCTLLGVYARQKVLKLLLGVGISKIVFWISLLIVSQLTAIRTYMPSPWTVIALFLVARALSQAGEFEIKPDPTARKLPGNGGEDSRSRTSNQSTRPILPEEPEISYELEHIIDNIIRDFVVSWYSSISDDTEAPFLSELSTILDEMTRKFQKTVCKIDLPELLICKILPVVTRHFKAYKTARKAVKIIHNDAREDNQSFAIAVEFGREYKIHKSISLGLDDLSIGLEKYSRLNSDLLLQTLMSPKQLSSRFVRIISREVLCCCIFSPLLQKVTEPCFINAFIVSTADALLEERSQVRELRAALSSQLDESPSTSSQPFDQSSLLNDVVIGIEADASGFKEVLKGISCIKTEKTLRSLKVSLMCQIVKLKKLENLRKEESLLLSRYNLALNLIESRLRYLRTNLFGLPPSQATVESGEFEALEKFIDSVSISDVLKDKSCKGFFSDYLRTQDTKGERCLGFWSKVEEFKNPLEDANNGELAVVSDEGFDDLVKIVEEFFAGRNLFIMQALNEQCAAHVSDFGSTLTHNGKVAASEHYSAARRNVLQLHSLAFNFLERSCFPAFKQSDEFLRMVSDSESQASISAFKTIAAELANNDDNMGWNSPHSNANDVAQVLESLEQKENKDLEGRTTNGVRARKSYSNLFGKRNDSSLFENKIFEDDGSMNEEYDTCSDEDGHDSSYLLESSESSRKTGCDESEPDLAIRSLNQSTLKNTIAELTISIDHLKKQLSLINHLGLKADLTDSVPELRLLRKSERAVNREILQQELLRQQLIVQEDANSLYKKCQISIKTSLSDISPRSGREVVFYVVSVSHVSNEILTSWDVPRRYNEFYELNAYLKTRYKGLVNFLQRKEYFPEKVKMSLVYHVSKNLLYKERTVKLERFLRCLLQIPEICQDTHFRRFLTDTNSAFTIKQGLGRKENREKLLSRVDSVSSKLFESKANVSAPSGTLKEAKTSVSLRHNYDNLFLDDEESKKGVFIRPLCGFLVSVFSLKDSRSSWLRGRALLVVIQQLLGSTIEKYIKDSIERITNPASIAATARKIRMKLWVDDVFFKNSEQKDLIREREEGAQIGMEAKSKLQNLMGETCGRVFGLKTSKEASAEIFSMLQNEYLNASLLLEIIDIILAELFANIT
ncbi:LAME_0E01882g1_1 [Lachancea meyersii CBS 8951]|uniref:LAME_0E01882g1_1 n=1 Tax=Lachancea meyersii CBS 8951 TaxID=1266667 RepID=A0A1G4JFJ3_9SACH|nr:LAME_0E01882g1_1 [Lachancea meyersii CBS 8951]